MSNHAGDFCCLKVHRKKKYADGDFCFSFWKRGRCVLYFGYGQKKCHLVMKKMLMFIVNLQGVNRFSGNSKRGTAKRSF